MNEKDPMFHIPTGPDGDGLRAVDADEFIAWVRHGKPGFRVGLDTVGPATVSTCLVDNTDTFQSPYETMVSWPGNEAWGNWGERYKTKSEAAAGHARTVERVRKEVGECTT